MTSSIPEPLRGILKDNTAAAAVCAHQYDGCMTVATELLGDTSKDWKVSMDAVRATKDCVKTDLIIKRVGATLKEQVLSVDISFNAWSADKYVFAPACLYNGNRFEAIPINYPPQVEKPEHLGADAPMVITDVPRLNHREGPSRVDLLAGDLSTPVFGYYDDTEKHGFLLFFEPQTELGNTGFSFEESKDRSQALLRLKFPGVREATRYYQFSTGKHPSPDTGADINEGAEFHTQFNCFSFSCADIHEFYRVFYEQRKCLIGGGVSRHEYSFSQTFKVQESKYNRENWNEAEGYYRVGVKDHIHHDFQTGWVGGAISSLPLLVRGAENSRERALKTVEFLLLSMQAPSGLFYGVHYKGKHLGDCFKDESAPWHLLRKSADALYFAFKHIIYLQKEEPDWCLPAEWEAALTRCADAFVQLWKRYGQFGQFVNHDTGEIIVGGSLSAGIAPAALVLASRVLNRSVYLDIASDSAEQLFSDYVDKGVSTGGPGEIAQCPDSESAFGFLESLVLLYEHTADDGWLRRAEQMAWQCASWCMSYDYTFPKGSAFGRYQLQATGSVWANVQNKHSSPGICTLSGDSLFKLYRATGDLSYLELISEIGHNITQYLSREEKPIVVPAKTEGDRVLDYKPMPAGWMNERVQTSDWNEPPGEVFNGSTWAEVACMLTAVELPGVYWQTDSKIVCAIDHVEAVLEAEGKSLLITNPTDCVVELTVLCETAAQAKEPLHQQLWSRCRRLSLKAGDSVTLSA